MAPISHTGILPWIQLRNAIFHPAIFQKMIGRTSPTAKNGDLVAVYDRDANRFGSGLLSTQSQIGLRMLTYDATPIDESFIHNRLTQAANLRKNLDATTNAYRLTHAEGDALPGLIIDRFGDYAVVELFNYPMYRRLDAIKNALKEILGVKEVLARADERVQTSEGFVMSTNSPAGATTKRSADRKSTVITENGVRFQIDLTHGHKTGFFCDQRENRLLLAQLIKGGGAEVLDLCSYTGGFAIYAATLGKAHHVTAVDLDEDAIALAQRNANLNKIPHANFTTIHSDIFPYLRQTLTSARKFDVIILDPPKLIPTKEDFFEGRGKYFDMNKLALSCLKPNATFLTCSCSGLFPPEEFLAMLRGAARFANRRVQIFRTTGPGPDHPIMTDCPESAYLKAFWCKVW